MRTIPGKAVFAMLLVVLCGVCVQAQDAGNVGLNAQPAEANKPAADPKPVAPENLTDAKIDMIFVRGGIFTTGCTAEQGSDCSDNEKLARQVTLSDYYIGKYEVTQRQWKNVMGNNPSSFLGDNLPVEQVSWDDVQEFIKRLNERTGGNYRLPTEAEWEYAAHGGNQSRGYKYSGSHTLGDVGWYASNSEGKTHPVGTRRANKLGIYDMSGNVWEWVENRQGEYGSSAQTNPAGHFGGSYRVPQGEGWSGLWNARGSSIGSLAQGNRNSDLGFRLARSLQNGESAVEQKPAATAGASEMAVNAHDNGATSQDGDIWSNPTNSNQLNGTWRGSFSYTGNYKEIEEAEGQIWSSQMEEQFGDIKATLSGEMMFTIVLNAKTMSISSTINSTYTGKNLDAFWLLIKPDDEPENVDGIKFVFNDEKKSVIQTATSPAERLTDEMITEIMNDLQINQNGTKIKFPAGYVSPIMPEIIMTKQIKEQ